MLKIFFATVMSSQKFNCSRNGVFQHISCQNFEQYAQCVKENMNEKKYYTKIKY